MWVLNRMELRDARAIAKKNNLSIDFVGYGIAYRVGDLIVMNKNLLNYENYCKAVLEHECRHSNGYKLKDIIMDMTEGNLWENFRFCLKHPKGFLQVLPLSIHKGTIYLDLINFFIISLVILWFVLVVFIIKSGFLVGVV